VNASNLTGSSYSLACLLVLPPSQQLDVVAPYATHLPLAACFARSVLAWWARRRQEHPPPRGEFRGHHSDRRVLAFPRS